MINTHLFIQLNHTYSNPELFELLSYSNFSPWSLEPTLWMNSYNLAPFIRTPAYSNFFSWSLESSNKWDSTAFKIPNCFIVINDRMESGPQSFTVYVYRRHFSSHYFAYTPDWINFISFFKPYVKYLQFNPKIHLKSCQLLESFS